MTTTEIIAKRHDQTQESCLTRIRHLRSTLDSIEAAVKDSERTINDLGELQGVAVILDCRLASLGTLRQLKDEVARSA